MGSGAVGVAVQGDDLGMVDEAVGDVDAHVLPGQVDLLDLLASSDGDTTTDETTPDLQEQP